MIYLNFAHLYILLDELQLSILEITQGAQTTRHKDTISKITGEAQKDRALTKSEGLLERKQEKEVLATKEIGLEKRARISADARVEQGRITGEIITK